MTMGGVADFGGKVLGAKLSSSPFGRVLGAMGSGQGLGDIGTAFQPKVKAPSVMPDTPVTGADPSASVAAANIASLPPAPVVGGQGPQAGAKAAPVQQGGGRKFEGMARKYASKWGIDPGTAVRVLNAEGGLDTWQQSKVRNKKTGAREPSYGPGQFLIGGGNTGFPEGLGNRFIKDTGLDPRDEANAEPYFDYMMKEVSQRGWGQWYGAKAAGVGNFAGVGGRPPGGRSPMLDNVMGGTNYVPGQGPSASYSPFQTRMFGGSDMTPGEGETAQKDALTRVAEAVASGGGGGGSMGVAQGGGEEQAAPAVDLGAEEVAGNQQALIQRAAAGTGGTRQEQRKAAIKQRIGGM